MALQWNPYTNAYEDMVDADYFYNPHDDPQFAPPPAPTPTDAAPPATPPTATPPTTTPPTTPAYQWWRDPNAKPPTSVDGWEWYWAGEPDNEWKSRRTGGTTNTTDSGDQTVVPGASNWDDGSGYQFPEYQSAGPFTPRRDSYPVTPFSYDPFTQTKWDDLYDEQQNPGFQKSQDRLSKMVQNSAAYRGVLRSGMTIGDLSSVLDTNQMQKFGEFDARRFRNYSSNRANAFDAWGANLGAERNRFLDEYGVDRDIYDRSAQDVDRGNNFRFNVADRELSAILNRWNTLVNATVTASRPV